MLILNTGFSHTKSQCKKAFHIRLGFLSIEWWPIVFNHSEHDRAFIDAKWQRQEMHRSALLTGEDKVINVTTDIIITWAAEKDEKFSTHNEPQMGDGTLVLLSKHHKCQQNLIMRCDTCQDDTRLWWNTFDLVCPSQAVIVIRRVW